LQLPGAPTLGSGTLPLVFFGNEQQKQKYLPKIAAGEIVGAYALSEATSVLMRSTAEPAPSFQPMASTIC